MICDHWHRDKHVVDLLTSLEYDLLNGCIGIVLLCNMIRATFHVSGVVDDGLQAVPFQKLYLSTRMLNHLSLMLISPSLLAFYNRGLSNKPLSYSWKFAKRKYVRWIFEMNSPLKQLFICLLVTYLVLALLINSSVKIAANGRLFSSMTFDLLAAALLANQNPC